MTRNSRVFPEELHGRSLSRIRGYESVVLPVGQPVSGGPAGASCVPTTGSSLRREAGRQIDIHGLRHVVASLLVAIALVTTIATTPVVDAILGKRCFADDAVSETLECARIPR